MLAHCINTDAEVLEALEAGINAFKKLPFEIGNGDDYTNSVYNAVAEKFLERMTAKRDDIILEVLREVDREHEQRKRK